MAAAKKTAKRAPKKKSAPAPEPEVEDTELEDDEELEEMEADEVEESPKSSAQEVTFGVADLCKYLTSKTGKKVTPRELRTLIRKMARDNSGRVNREIKAGNRSRYDWPEGLKDPEVKAIIKAFNAGELEADKQEKLQALKDRKAKKTAEKPTKKTKKRKPEPEPEDEDDEDEDLELEDED